MDNHLTEFEELLLDNALLKVQNQALADKNLKWKEWWQMVQEITKEQIQDNLEFTHVNEEVYLNELFAYRLKFLNYKYEQLHTKLIEEPIGIAQILSYVQPMPTTVNHQNKLVKLLLGNR